MSDDLPDKQRFVDAYRGQPPWDIAGPQPPFVEVADQLSGTILDAGCGTGENALFFSARGHSVYGIDFLETPIARARRKAADRGLEATFLVMDALALQEIPRQFDNTIDCGLFHVFSNEDRARYVQGLAEVLRPGGRVWLLCFSDREPGTGGPRRITQSEIREAFAGCWQIESIRPTRFAVHPDTEEARASSRRVDRMRGSPSSGAKSDALVR